MKRHPLTYQQRTMRNALYTFMIMILFWVAVICACVSLTGCTLPRAGLKVSVAASKEIYFGGRPECDCCRCCHHHHHHHHDDDDDVHRFHVEHR